MGFKSQQTAANFLSWIVADATVTGSNSDQIFEALEMLGDTVTVEQYENCCRYFDRET